MPSGEIWTADRTSLTNLTSRSLVESAGSQSSWSIAQAVKRASNICASGSASSEKPSGCRSRNPIRCW